jgi:hypothetical protein
MIEASTAIKECVKFESNDRVVVLDAAILEILVGEFDIEIRDAEKDSWLGSISSDYLYDVFEMADGLKNGN